MDLFLREFGPVGAPTIVFLHGGRSSGWSWEPVVQRLPQYRALVPDLPQYGQSSQQGPFEIDRAADAVAALIRSRAGSARVHLVGFSLGAQVGLQLLATEPDLVDRALLCGTVVNRLPGVRVTQLLLGLLARTPASLRPTCTVEPKNPPSTSQVSCRFDAPDGTTNNINYSGFKTGPTWRQTWVTETRSPTAA